MPEYIYICANGHELEVNEGMFCDAERICNQCDTVMWRKPMMPAVTWGGLSPSQGELAPVIQDIVDNEDENRANYLAQKETTDEKVQKETSCN